MGMRRSALLRSSMESRGGPNDAGESAPRTKIDVRWLGAAISAGKSGMAFSYGVILP